MTFTRKPHVHHVVRLSATAALLAPLMSPLLLGGVANAAPAEPQVTLEREAGSALSSATVPVPPGQEVTTSEFTMIAATWSGDASAVEVRTHTEGEWTGWIALEELEDGPGSVEASRASAREASELHWVGESDGVEVRTGSGARGLQLVLINPGVESTDADPAIAPESQPDSTTPQLQMGTTATRRTVARPKIFTRAQWRADESWRNGSPEYTDTFKQMHVHHTVNANRYASWQVAGIIRGIYRYHTQTLGWFDIGYNFVIDRYGRIWEGRSGGMDRLVRGAHTLGFNHNSTGVAVIGNYDTRTVSTTVLRALADLGAWKFDSNNRFPLGKIWVTSTGSDKFARGTNVRLYRIDGHRDTNDTSCPGRYLYAALPQLRSMTYHRMYS